MIAPREEKGEEPERAEMKEKAEWGQALSESTGSSLDRQHRFAGNVKARDREVKAWRRELSRWKRSRKLPATLSLGGGPD